MVRTQPALTSFKALVFDVYGTLADWETTIYEGLVPLAKKYPQSAEWDRKATLLAFSKWEKEIQAKQPDLLYRDVLANVYQRLEAELSGQSAGEELSKDAQKFGDLVKQIEPFPDSSAALHSLANHFKLCVLSNVDRESFGYTHTRLSIGTPKLKLDDATIAPYIHAPSNVKWLPRSTSPSGETKPSPFSLIMTAQDTGTYKPDLNGFRRILDVIKTDPHLLGTEPDFDPTRDVLWVAQSIFHDIHPATSLGLKTVWINRSGGVMGVDGEEGQSWIWRFDSLEEFATSVQQASRDST